MHKRETTRSRASLFSSSPVRLRVPFPAFASVTMATEPRGPNSSAEKQSVHKSIIGEHVVQLAYTPRAPPTQEVEALARTAFRKFDLKLVLPILITFCEYQYA